MKKEISSRKKLFTCLILIFLFCGSLFAQERDEKVKRHKDTRFDTFVGSTILTLDLGYLGTGLKNNGWGAGLKYEAEIFRYFSIRPGFSHMTLFPKDRDYHIITVGISLELLYYPFGRGLDWLYLGVGQNCDFIMYTGGSMQGSKEKDTAINLYPQIGWKQNFLDYVMADIFVNYKIYLNENELHPAAQNILQKGFQYGIKIQFNLPKIWNRFFGKK